MIPKGEHQWAPVELATAFSFAHDLLLPPDPEQHARLVGESCAASWRYLAGLIPHLDDHLDLPSQYPDFESRYIATFDVGIPTPQVPLLESHYNKRDPLPRILHENILFYQQFGLRLSSKSNESSDHLRHQLEFVSYLFSLLARIEASDDAASRDQIVQIRQALGDYLSRHLLSWLPQAVTAAGDAPLGAAGQVLELTLALSQTALRYCDASKT